MHGVMLPQLNVSPFTRVRNICCGNKMFLKNVRKHCLLLNRKKMFPQQMFPVGANGEILGKQCLLNNVSTFAGPLACEEKRKPEYLEKTCRCKERTNNKLSPHMSSGPRIKPEHSQWEASGLTTAPPPTPKKCPKTI